MLESHSKDWAACKASNVLSGGTEGQLQETFGRDFMGFLLKVVLGISAGCVCLSVHALGSGVLV
jgi:hypothetical protein